MGTFAFKINDFLLLNVHICLCNGMRETELKQLGQEGVCDVQEAFSKLELVTESILQSIDICLMIKITYVGSNVIFAYLLKCKVFHEQSLIVTGQRFLS